MAEAAEDKRTNVKVSLSIDGGEDNPLAVIRGITAGVRNIDRTLRDTVEEARRQGCSWQEIADALGVSRQSAWERFQKELPTRAQVVAAVAGSLGPWRKEGPTLEEFRAAQRSADAEREERKWGHLRSKQ